MKGMDINISNEDIKNYLTNKMQQCNSCSAIK